MAEKRQSFWSSVPGILTGIAAIITALTGFYIAAGSRTVDPPEHQNTPARMSEEIVGIEPITSENLPSVSTPQNKSLKPLVDCTHKAFHSPNTIDSLMSWSDYYHKQIEAAGGVRERAFDACTKAITYRAQAHCRATENLDIRQALFETLALCREAGITLDNVMSGKI
ncbi:MAG TPA: hypothetical protein ENG83_03080 [Nitrospirae bacterium]|nr:hypothetical protein BMS3Abin06_02479 [bacterium BMS3Abin06]HDH11176.1 hypothetical protein [Nitrospirota bacterium]HDZ00113.1 hypothetical protein [Nitrospirota bacterium]